MAPTTQTFVSPVALTTHLYIWGVDSPFMDSNHTKEYGGYRRIRRKGERFEGKTLGCFFLVIMIMLRAKQEKIYRWWKEVGREISNCMHWERKGRGKGDIKDLKSLASMIKKWRNRWRAYLISYRRERKRKGGRDVRWERRDGVLWR